MGSNSLVMDSKHQNGAEAELRAALWYTEQGYTIFWPSATHTPCDFIALNKGTNEIVRVQVKSAYWMTRPTGRSYLMCTTRKGCCSGGYDTYTEDDCDVIVISDRSKRLWVIPVDALEGAQSVCLDKGQDDRTRRTKRSFSPEKYEVTC